MIKTVKALFQVLATLFLAAILLVANLPEKEPAVKGTKEGESLPDFSITCLNGERFSLSEHAGKTVVINLWATWCTPCVKELPNFDRLRAERQDVAVLALHAPPVTTDVADFLSSFSYTIPFAVDEAGSLCELLDASTVLPQTIIVNADGVVTYNRIGALSYEALCDLVDADK